MNQIAGYLITIPAVLLTIMLHELAHGYTAYRLGDPTAKVYGRLTLNPIRHIDIIGAVCMVLFHFGWAKPVPVNAVNFKNPKRDMALTALAGPLTNFVIAFFCVPIYLLLSRAYVSVALENGIAFFGARLLETLTLFFWYLTTVNLGLCLFNLIPLPPLDGSRILFAFLPDAKYYSIMRYERYFSLALMIFLLLGANFGFLSIFSGAIRDGMETVWSIIPIFR